MTKVAGTIFVLAVAFFARLSSAAPLASVSVHERLGVRHYTLYSREIGFIELTQKASSLAAVPVTTLSDHGAQTVSVSYEPLLLTGKVRRVSLQPYAKVAGMAFPKSGAGNGDVYILLDVTSDKRGAIRKRDYFFTFDPSRPQQTVKLRRGIPAALRAISPRRCPVTGAGGGASSGSTAGSRTALSPTRYVNLFIDADSRFRDEFGARTPQAVLYFLYAANLLYLNQIGIELRLEGMNVFTTRASDPVGEKFTDSLDLLETYRAYVIGQNRTSDVSHLFTQSRGFVDAVGLSYIGTVCTTTTYNMAWDDLAFERASDFTVTFAHELGHSLGAEHDEDDPTSVMGAGGSTNITNPFFSDFSIDQISSFVQSEGSCLDSPHGNALSSDVTKPHFPSTNKAKNIRLSCSASGRTLRGSVRNLAGKPLSGRPIDILRYGQDSNEIIAVRITNSKGQFQLNVSQAGYYFCGDRKTRKSGYLLRVN
jgi:hypothetical protein